MRLAASQRAGVFRLVPWPSGDRLLLRNGNWSRGKPLKRGMRREPPARLKLETALEIATQVARALIAAAGAVGPSRPEAGDIHADGSESSLAKIEVKGD